MPPLVQFGSSVNIDVVSIHPRLFRRGNFDQWELTCIDGRTVAHVAAAHGTLPDNFDQWQLMDADGRTVAHKAARYNNLPPDFYQVDLLD